mmetsp:Transcript_42891/g.112728  ORF Transcript_42891/g.112728 Transcript_42891/m.112728 type:complete len:131 (+) Transcript_42891:221-613(+)
MWLSHKPYNVSAVSTSICHMACGGAGLIGPIKWCCTRDIELDSSIPHHVASQMHPASRYLHIQRNNEDNLLTIHDVKHHLLKRKPGFLISQVYTMATRVIAHNRLGAQVRSHIAATAAKAFSYDLFMAWV